jgi:dihydroorotate dehydrogenase
VGTPPPAAAPVDDEWVEAPISGPVALPFTLRALRAVAEMGLDAPIIAAGGIHSLDDALLCLDLGASAVQIRSLVWRDPAAAHRLALNIRQFMPGEADQEG